MRRRSVRRAGDALRVLRLRRDAVPRPGAAVELAERAVTADCLNSLRQQCLNRTGTGGAIAERTVSAVPSAEVPDKLGEIRIDRIELGVTFGFPGEQPDLRVPDLQEVSAEDP